MHRYLTGNGRNIHIYHLSEAEFDRYYLICVTGLVANKLSLLCVFKINRQNCLYSVINNYLHIVNRDKIGVK